MKKIIFFLLTIIFLLIFFTGCPVQIDNNNNNDKKTTHTPYMNNLDLDKIINRGGTEKDRFEKIIESDDYFTAVGFSASDLTGLGGNNTKGDNDFVIAQFDKTDLTLSRINNFGGTESDKFFAVIESDEHYIAVGESKSDLRAFSGGSDNMAQNDFVIAKIKKSDLSLVSINNFGQAADDHFTSIIEDENHYIAAGYSKSNLSGFPGGTDTTGADDFVIAKLNKTDLSLVSINNFGGTIGDYFFSMIDSEEHCIVAGYSESDLRGFTGGSDAVDLDEFVIVKIKKSDLSVVRINNFGGTKQDRLFSLIESEDYYIAVGSSYSNLSAFAGGGPQVGQEDFVIIKYNKSDLSLVHLNNFGGTSYDKLFSVIDYSNYYIGAGYSSSDLSDLPNGNDTNGRNDFAIIRFNKSDLSLSKSNNFGGDTFEYFHSIILSDTDFIAVGRSRSDLRTIGANNTAGDDDFVISRFK
ncbi:MAG: hypothetical protein MJB14_16870 [Spirochaetes bacterium]|nr:hypothetical protein [Spirochaetota bacterium]